MRYFYDAEGNPTAIRLFTIAEDGETTSELYYLGTNLQGDVVAIYNSAGTKICSYEYDAWGNTIKTSYLAAGSYTIGRANPFRYRGYYYDLESGLYYLNSRYYNPNWSRFINADGYVSTGQGLLGYNMYAYCNNNPVMGVDPTGQSFIDSIESFLDDCRSVVDYCFTELPSIIADSIVIDIGVGNGLGVDAEIGRTSASAIVRADFFAIQKASGKNSQVSFEMVTENSISISTGVYAFQNGEKIYYDFNGIEKRKEHLESGFETTIPMYGVSAYAWVIGGTFKIGFDVEYFISHFY